MERNRLLVECLKRQHELAKAERPPDWRFWDVEEYEDAILNGPQYHPTLWFGPIPNYIRQRFIRVIESLERDGLLVSWKRNGFRLTNIKLTPDGECIAKTLLEKEGSNECSIETTEG